MIKLISICACIGGLILATRLLFQASLIVFKSILRKHKIAQLYYTKELK